MGDDLRRLPVLLALRQPAVLPLLPPPHSALQILLPHVLCGGALLLQAGRSLQLLGRQLECSTDDSPTVCQESVTAVIHENERSSVPRGNISKHKNSRWSQRSETYTPGNTNWRYRNVLKSSGNFTNVVCLLGPCICHLDKNSLSECQHILFSLWLVECVVADNYYFKYDQYVWWGHSRCYVVLQNSDGCDRPRSEFSLWSDILTTDWTLKENGTFRCVKTLPDSV